MESARKTSVPSQDTLPQKENTNPTPDTKLLPPVEVKDTVTDEKDNEKESKQKTPTVQT